MIEPPEYTTNNPFTQISLYIGIMFLYRESAKQKTIVNSAYLLSIISSDNRLSIMMLSYNIAFCKHMSINALSNKKVH